MCRKSKHGGVGSLGEEGMGPDGGNGVELMVEGSGHLRGYFVLIPYMALVKTIKHFILGPEW